MIYLDKNMIVVKTSAAIMLLLLLILPSSTLAALKVGDSICTEGFIMDLFCINRGTLFDNPSVRTLENPGVHSIHCLVDVNSCVISPFEVLLDPAPAATGQLNLYKRGWRLDENAKQLAIELAQEVGTCSTCAEPNTAEDSHVRGFRTAMNAIIQDLNEDDPSMPPTIKVLEMRDTTAYNLTESACQTYFGMQDILDVNENTEDDASLCDKDSSTLSLQAGDELCTEGYIMDLYCIDRGTLFDNPSIPTLEDPGAHSIHCLVDVESCVSSPFEILLDPTSADGTGLYTRGWRLDEPSKEQAVELAHQVGSCTNCDTANTADNSHVMGFRAAVKAVIIDLNENDSSAPPTIKVLGMEDTTAYNSASAMNACQTYFSMPDITDVICSSSSSGSSLLDGIAVTANSGVNTLRTKHLAHGSLMLIGWGFLLPSGTLMAKFYKHRPDGAWFKFHRAIQMIGLLCALVGWIIALVNFNVFKDVGFVTYRHGICGMVVMILGLLQPLNAFFRPHPTDDENNKSRARFVWEIVHKSSGWLAVGLAVPTIVMGTLSLPSLEDQTMVQIGYGVGCIGGLLILTAYLFYDKTTLLSENEQQQTQEKVSEQEEAKA